MLAWGHHLTVSVVAKQEQGTEDSADKAELPLRMLKKERLFKNDSSLSTRRPGRCAAKVKHSVFVNLKLVSPSQLCANHMP